MMAGGPSDVPPGGTPFTDSALAARLVAAKAALVATRQELTTAQSAIATRDAVAAAAADAARDAVGDRRAPAGPGVGGGEATDRKPAEAAAAANTAGRNANPPAGRGVVDARRGTEGPPAGALGPVDAPLGGDNDADYEDEDEGDDGKSNGGRAPAIDGGVRGGCARRAALEETGAYDDGFDFPTRISASNWLQSFDIPRSVMRADGLPMPFTPCDPVHTATFTIGSRDEIEARHWYCSPSWTQQIYNDVLDAKFAVGNTKEYLEELFDYLVSANRSIYAIGVSRYAYLALWQSEPNLADAFAYADAVPRNSLRGDGARRFIFRVVRAETHASAKIGAAERGYTYPQRGNRAHAPAPPRGGRGGPAKGGGGGGAGAGFGGGGGGGRGGDCHRGGGNAGRGRGRNRA